MESRLHTVVKIIKSEDKIYFKGGDSDGYAIDKVFYKIELKIDFEVTFWEITYKLIDYNNIKYLAIYEIKGPVNIESYLKATVIRFERATISKYFDFRDSDNYINFFKTEPVLNYLNKCLKHLKRKPAVVIIPNKFLTLKNVRKLETYLIDKKAIFYFIPKWELATFSHGKLSIRLNTGANEVELVIFDSNIFPAMQHVFPAFLNSFLQQKIAFTMKNHNGIFYSESFEAKFYGKKPYLKGLKKAKIDAFAKFLHNKPVGNISSLLEYCSIIEPINSDSTTEKIFQRVIEDLINTGRLKRNENISFLAKELGYKHEIILYCSENNKIGFAFCCNKESKSYIYELEYGFGTYCWIGSEYEKNSDIELFDIENELSLIINCKRNPYKSRKMAGFEVIEHDSQSFEDWKIKINEFIAKANSFKIE
jgi:hypothetical protein